MVPYFKQLLSGKDFAKNDNIAKEMRNFCYLLGDKSIGKAVVIDPAYDPKDILNILENDQMELSGILVSHYHADHVGGDLFGLKLKGVAELLEIIDVPVHVNKEELPWVKRVTGLGDEELIAHDASDLLELGEIKIRLLHTPGHTPGSQCFYVNDSILISGDTLFLDGCGRTDLPGSDPEKMYYSLSNVLAKLPDETVIYPGHFYSRESCAALGNVKEKNFVFKPKSLEEWLRIFN
jgi:glyoxylase-like metal-dependent hydrolase (beta-lactamase superfamily II)